MSDSLSDRYTLNISLVVPLASVRGIVTELITVPLLESFLNLGAVFAIDLIYMSVVAVELNVSTTFTSTLWAKVPSPLSSVLNRLVVGIELSMIWPLDCTVTRLSVYVSARLKVNDWPSGSDAVKVPIT